MPQLFPTLNAPAVVTPAPAPIIDRTPYTWGISPLFDFSTNSFLLNGNNDLVIGDEATALSQWMTGAIITERLRYYIHQRIFGSDFDLLVGKNYPSAIVKKRAEQYTREAIENDTRIAAVKSVVARPYKRYVVVDCVITPVRGKEQQFQVKWSV